MSEFLFHEGDPTMVLALASSIAMRNVQEQSRQHSILAETIPLPPQPPAEVLQSIQTGATVAMLESLENPEREIDILARTKTIIDDNTIIDLLRSGNEEPSRENIETTRLTIDVQIKTMWEHFASDHDAQQEMKDLLEAAQNVADRHAVPVYDVFSDDSLYAEYIRTKSTPQEYAEGFAVATEKLDQEYGLALIDSLAVALLQAEMDNGEITEEEYAEEIRVIKQGLRRDEEMLSELNASLFALRQASYKLLLEEVGRFWGKQAVDELSLFLGQLAAKAVGDAPLSSSMREQQQYNDIVATLCMEKEWDPKSLTIEQMDYINSSPQVMQYFEGRD